MLNINKKPKQNNSLPAWNWNTPILPFAACNQGGIIVDGDRKALTVRMDQLNEL